jgi:phosphoribosylformylglycinamidine cyclo-ligase
MAHITGGGLLDNVPRMLPAGLAAEIDPTAWQTLPLFAYLAATGNLPAEESYRTFNMGIGFVLAVGPEDETEVRDALPEASTIGRISPDRGQGSGVRGQVTREEA